MTGKRSAYTLFEVVLVLALVVIGTSLTFPLAQTLLADNRLSVAADIVRGGLVEARNRAVEEGRSYLFAWNPQEAAFLVGPAELASLQDPPFAEGDHPELVVRSELPQEIVFGALISATPSSAPDGQWQRIVFRPDGSTSDGDVDISFGKADGPLVAVRLRGLTGAISTVEQPSASNRP